MADVRTFIALHLTAEVCEQVASLVADLKLRQKNGLKWVAPEAWHFTLAFLGYLAEDRLDAARQACSAAASRHALFVFRLGPLGFFPPRGRVSVLWAGLSQGEAEMTALQQDLAADLRARGLVLESRPFVPHLTLARAQPGANVKREWIEGQAGQLAGATQLAGSIEVMRSDLSPAGARYTVLASCPLAAPATSNTL
jgi:2'-5' RNA ligase